MHQSETRPVDFPLVGGLASLTLTYPILRVATNVLGSNRVVSSNVRLWVVIWLVWVLVVRLTRAARPLATLTLTGLATGILTILVVGVIQVTASGSVDVSNAPIGSVALIALSTLGGTVCGLIARWLRSRDEKPRL